MTSKLIDTLAILASKAAPLTFDLSSELLNISLRDQWVRGHLLARDIHAWRGEKPYTVLVVGAGMAGVAFATQAAELGAKVVLVDRATEPMSLQRQATHRFVGPYMYEWPAAYHDDQHCPAASGQCVHMSTISTHIPWGQSDPQPAAIVATDVSTALRNCIKNLRPGRLTVLAPIMKPLQLATDIRRFILAASSNKPFKFSVQGKLWHAAPQAHVVSRSFFADFVVLAAGLGKERSIDNVPPTPFWLPDRLKDPSVRNQKILIIGGGDGALQDTIRASSNFDHSYDLFRAIKQWSPKSYGVLEELLPDLMGAEEQNRLFTTWTEESKVATDLIERRCITTANQFLSHLANLSAKKTKDLASHLLRPGTGSVHLSVQSNQFTKAYVSNRLAVYLLAAIASKARLAGSMSLTLGFSESVVSVTPYASGFQVATLSAGASSSAWYDMVIPRIGQDSSTPPPGVQMVGLTKRDTTSRALARISLPYTL